jgi:ABC-type Fe3+-hydroxamate transport system substrate-binding protein
MADQIRVQRVVSLFPSMTEALMSWGVSPVGVTQWCPPCDAVTVRGTKNPDLEAIIALDPDLVIVNTEENRKVDVERLIAAGIRVHITRAESLIEAAQTFTDLAMYFGEPARELGQQIAAIPMATEHLSVFCPVWRDPWIALGIQTVAADLLAHAGFAVVPTIPRYPRVDLAEVPRPDAVLLPDEPYAFSDVDHQAFEDWQVPIRNIDGAALTWWGPRTPAAVAMLSELCSELLKVKRS